ncbi:MAG: hypothetical protein OXC13_00725 [Caldilineaceae bacterium]|nr:hypothetical protein [Caldilineaceae bacterium]
MQIQFPGSGFNSNVVDSTGFEDRLAVHVKNLFLHATDPTSGRQGRIERSIWIQQLLQGKPLCRVAAMRCSSQEQHLWSVAAQGLGYRAQADSRRGKAVCFVEDHRIPTVCTKGLQLQIARQQVDGHNPHGVGARIRLTIHDRYVKASEASTVVLPLVSEASRTADQHTIAAQATEAASLGQPQGCDHSLAGTRFVCHQESKIR